MPTYANIDGTQKEIKNWYANINAEQKQIHAMFANINAEQKQIYAMEIVYQWYQYNSVGTNYYRWNSYDVITAHTWNKYNSVATTNYNWKKYNAVRQDRYEHKVRPGNAMRFTKGATVIVLVKQNCNTTSKNQADLKDHLLTKGGSPLLKECGLE